MKRRNVVQVTAPEFADWIAKNGGGLTLRGHTGFDIYVNTDGQQVAQAAYEYKPAVFKVDTDYQGKPKDSA